MVKVFYPQSGISESKEGYTSYKVGDKTYALGENIKVNDIFLTAVVDLKDIPNYRSYSSVRYEMLNYKIMSLSVYETEVKIQATNTDLSLGTFPTENRYYDVDGSHIIETDESGYLFDAPINSDSVRNTKHISYYGDPEPF